VVSSFRNFIEKGGKHEPERDRYHLYVARICPWASRALILRKLKGLEDIVSLTVLSPYADANGWAFAKAAPEKLDDVDDDPLYQSNHIKDLYFRADPDYAGRFTVPVLWDKKLHTIVNNESSEIIRIFNSAFNEFLPADKAALDYYPEGLRSQIDEINDLIFPNINAGVYKAGFATSQQAYQTAVTTLFDALDKVENVLTQKDYLVGDQLTEADVRLYVTIIRFDTAYVGHYKCNIRTIRDGYPAIHKWLRKLYWNNSAFKDTTDFEHIKIGYYWSQAHINPTRVVPVGPLPHILPLEA